MKEATMVWKYDKGNTREGVMERGSKQTMGAEMGNNTFYTRKRKDEAANGHRGMGMK
jgi:hypothetical protein